jgi:hypothetical protein
MPNYRFSGHETFPCRYTWLPKAARALKEDHLLFADEENAMVTLGVGKNMARAIKFWVLAAGVANAADGGGYSITPLGRALLSTDGFDPFLEDIRTLWLIHWKLSTNYDEPLFAWHYMLNNWPHPEISRSEVLKAFRKEAVRLGRELSTVTLEQHFDTFLHTYIPTRGRKGDIQEDNLDCPLVELELLQRVGESPLEGSDKREPVYAFRREEKPEITPELFIFCLNDFWARRHAGEGTLSFRSVSVSEGSPGQIFKLPESDVRERLGRIIKTSGGAFNYHESATRQYVERNVPHDTDFLSMIYQTEEIYA